MKEELNEKIIHTEYSRKWKIDWKKEEKTNKQRQEI